MPCHNCSGPHIRSPESDCDAYSPKRVSNQTVCVVVEYYGLNDMSFSGHPNIPDSVSAVLREIGENPRVEKIVLFGSRALGDHNPRSDVDVAISGQLSRAEWVRLRDAVDQARSLYWLSLVDLDSSPEDLRNRILETGCTIYVRS